MSVTDGLRKSVLHAGWSAVVVGVLTIALDSLEFFEAEADLISETLTAQGWLGESFA